MAFTSKTYFYCFFGIGIANYSIFNNINWNEKYNLWVGTGYTSGSHGGIGTSQGIRAKEFIFYDSFEPVNDGSSTGKQGDSSGSKIWHLANQGITFDTQIKDSYGLGGFYQTAGYINQSGFYATGNVTAYASDIRLKENILPIESAVHKALQIRGVEFDWKDEAEDLGFYPRHKHEPGLIAQEVEKVIPEVVHEDADGYKSISYPNITAVLVEAIKEQQNDINKLKEQVKELQNGNS